MLSGSGPSVVLETLEQRNSYALFTVSNMSCRGGAVGVATEEAHPTPTDILGPRGSCLDGTSVPACGMPFSPPSPHGCKGRGRGQRGQSPSCPHPQGKSLTLLLQWLAPVLGTPPPGTWVAASFPPPSSTPPARLSAPSPANAHTHTSPHHPHTPVEWSVVLTGSLMGQSG